MNNIPLKIYGYFALLLLCTFIVCVLWPKPHRPEAEDIIYNVEHDTLRVGVCHSPTAWSITSDGWAGYDYDLINLFSKSQGRPIKLYPLTASRWVSALRNEVDIIAYPCPITKENKDEILFLPMQEAMPLVVVQLEKNKALTNTAQLNRHKVMVRRNSPAHRQVLRLNEEIGGGMRIGLLHDTLSSDSLVRGVVTGKWALVAMPRYEAEVYKKCFPQLNIGLQISAKQPSGWAMNDTTLFTELLKWKEVNQATIDKLKQRYFEQAQLLVGSGKLNIGDISPYDTYFKLHAPRIHWDWKLLAALCYHESRFNPLTVSPAGACGLMQLMPITARRFGLNDTTMFEAEANIAAGVEYIKFLNMIYHHVEDKDERVKFILASYNAGPAHVLDAMRLAKKYGKNPHIWYNNVEEFLLKKSQPEYYEDSEVRFGQFNGRPTCAYVKNVMSTYHEWCVR